MQGICTSPPSGSHVNPRLCLHRQLFLLELHYYPAIKAHSIPISAACIMIAGSAPKQAAIPAAYRVELNALYQTGQLTLIEHATPTSAIHPPSAADMVAPRLNSIPVAEAVKRKVMMLLDSAIRHDLIWF